MKLSLAVVLLLLSGCSLKCEQWDERVHMYESCRADSRCWMKPVDHMLLQDAKKNLDAHCKPENY